MDTDENELNSIKFAILRSLRNNKAGYYGQNTYMRNISVDLPLSSVQFNVHFLPKVEKFTICRNGAIKGKLSIDQLINIFRENVSEYIDRDSSISHRIFGVILFHFMHKKLISLAMTNVQGTNI